MLIFTDVLEFTASIIRAMNKPHAENSDASTIDAVLV
jgi:hypothetical protein